MSKFYKKKSWQFQPYGHAKNLNYEIDAPLNFTIQNLYDMIIHPQLPLR